MDCLDVDLEILLLCSGVVTLVTLVLDPLVFKLNMRLQRGFVQKLLATLITLILHAHVYTFNMKLKVGLSRELFRALITVISESQVFILHMLSHPSLSSCQKITLVAGVENAFVLGPDVVLQLSYCGELFGALIAGITDSLVFVLHMLPYPDF